MSTILVTGGAGFIGSHTVVELIQAGHTPVIIDNLCNASPQVIGRIAEITGHTPAFYQGDIRDRELLRRIFAEHPIQSVIHFAALKAVGESVKKPLEYYSNNVSGSLILPSASPANRCWLRQSARWAASAGSWPLQA